MKVIAQLINKDGSTELTDIYDYLPESIQIASIDPFPCKQFGIKKDTRTQMGNNTFHYLFIEGHKDE